MKDVNYIGSCRNIKERYYLHKRNCWNKKANRHNLLVYKFIREKNKNIELEILFCYKGTCSYRIILLVEQFYINKYDSKNNGLNTYNAFTNRKKYKKEWCEKNKDRTKEYNKKYYDKNKDKIYNQKKEYYQKNKDKKKEYQKENKDKILEYQKKYYEKNKEIKNAKRKIKIICPICKCSIINLKRHQRTKKCLKVKNLMFKFF